MTSTKPKCIISNTAALLTIALKKGTSRVPSIFTNQEVLERPTFSLYYEIVKLISRERPSIKWDSLFLSLECSSKQSKLIFLLRLLSLLSNVIGIRVDMAISPSMILFNSHDVSSKHILLQALATACLASEEVMTKAVSYVAAEGDARLYGIVVNTSKGVTYLQALFRGGLARKKTSCYARECFKDLLARKSKVEEEILDVEVRLKNQKDKLIRILKVKDMSLNTNKEYQRHYSRPRSAPLPDEPKSNLSSVTTNVYSVDREFAKSIVDISTIQSRIKKKEKATVERERRLKERDITSKNKEADLKLQQERLTELAVKIRKQRLHMKEQKRQLLYQHRQPAEVHADIKVNQLSLDNVHEEKKILLKTKTMKAKLRQRVRELNKREANIVRMAKELKKREIQLTSREVMRDETQGYCDEVDFFQKANSISTQKRQISLKSKKSLFHDDKGQETNSSMRDSCCLINTHKKDKDDPTSIEELTSKGGMSRSEEPTLVEKETDSNDKPQTEDKPKKMPSLILKPNRIMKPIARPVESALKHHNPREEGGKSHSLLHKRMTPQQSNYSNHVFTFEKKSDISRVDDLVDAQLRCVVNSLRELI